MHKKFSAKYVKIYLTIPFIVITVIACSAVSTGDKVSELEETLSVQSTWIAHLSTQVTRQEQTNWDQWENIGHLYTQMPYALGTITPIPPGVTITLTFTPTPAASIDIEYPPGTRTGIEEVDVVIDAILSVDIAPRLDLVRLASTACTTVDGLGGPPKCKPDEVDGTIVDAFPISNGEGHHVRLEELRTVFDFTVRGLTAVYVVPEDSYRAEYWPAGEYGIIFTSEDGGYPHVITVLVEDGKIVRLEYNTGWPPFDLIWQKSDEFILPPIR